MSVPPEHARMVSTLGSKVSIDHLPDELLVIIIKALDGSKMWHKLYRVSKRFKKITEEFLYRNLNFHDFIKRFSPDPRNALVPRYVQTLGLTCRTALKEDWLWILQHARNLQAVRLTFL